MAVKTVAIVGSHSKTRGEAPFDRNYVDIWVFNEAACIGWPKRVNAVFQIHTDVVWKNPVNRNHSEFPEWMQKKHPYPIYMQEASGEVPSSVRYPLEEICAELLPKLMKGKRSELKAGRHRRNGKSTSTQRVKYFTSTVAYAMALAIYQGYQRIEIYGVEMESNTEYTYQREGVFFWIGLAAGRGVEVLVHPQSGFFNEPLYGYEGDATLRKKDFEKRVDVLEPLIEQTYGRLEEANRKQRLALEEAMEESGGEPGMGANAHVKKYFASIKEQANAMIDLGMLEGARDEEKRYLAKAEAMEAATGEHFFSRQEFEISGAAAYGAKEKYQAKMQQVGAEAQLAWRAMEQAILAEDNEKQIQEFAGIYAAAHEKYLRAAYEYGRSGGLYQENLTLVAMVDELIKAAGGSKAEEAILASLATGGSKTEEAPLASLATHEVSQHVAMKRPEMGEMVAG